MIIKEKSRCEIEEKYKWDLSSIYESDEEFENDYNILKEEIKEIEKYRNNILKSADNLLEFLETYFNLSRKLEKLYMYAHLNHDSDTTENKYQVFYGKVSNLYQEFDNLTTFIIPELIKEDYSLIEKYMEEKEHIKAYKNYLKEVYKYKPHALSEKEEMIFSRLGKALSSPSNTYSKLTDSDMTLGIIEDESGNKIELTDRNYSKYITSKNREIRKNAFKSMYDSYHKFINTIASTMSAEVDINENISKIKKYNSAIEMSLEADDVGISVYNNLIDTVSNNLDILYKYFNLRKNILNLDELHLYDLYVDLVHEHDKKYDFETAKNLVLNALSVLGKNYIKDLNKAFDEKWIDVYSNKGKRSGAYSSGGYDTNPYLLLNYNDKLDDISTLAHELGHSMHSYYSRNNNTYQDADYKIFVAEVASTVNELLLFKYMLKNTNEKQEKLNILNRLMELFKATIYRQTMFAEFEKWMYEENAKGEVLTADFLSNKYYELNKKYFGENVIVDEDIKYEWARIPHFYYFFYVYKYATGLSAACYIVNNILDGKENAKENYLEFLKTGGKYYPIEELKIAGVDMNDPKVIESALNMFNEIIDEFNNVYNS